jgi:AcrR family transcriptional regulator
MHTGGVKVTGERLDPRHARTRARVYAAALEVLRRQGIGATTFDAIAQQAGVARSTLYRNWATRDDLLTEAIEEQAPFPVPPSGEPTFVRLESALREIATALSSTSWGWILPAALAATDASPVLFERYRSFTSTRRAAFTAIVSDGKAAGELPPALSNDDFVDALIGPLFFRWLIRQLPTSPAWVRNHLHRTLAAFDADLSAATGAQARAAATGVASPDPEPRGEPDGQEGSLAGQPAALRFPG